MTLDLQSLLPLYALGALEEHEGRQLEQAIARDPQLQRELAALRGALHDVPRGVPPVAPPAHLIERLLASAGGGRFERFAERFAAMFDVAVDRARELLGWIHDPTKWNPAVPGVALVHFRGGAAHAAADCGLVRIATGTSFPWHGHQGEELTLFLTGVGRDDQGRDHVAGGELVQEPGSAHSFSSVGEGDLIFAVRYHGLDFAAKRPE